MIMTLRTNQLGRGAHLGVVTRDGRIVPWRQPREPAQRFYDTEIFGDVAAMKGSAVSGLLAVLGTAMSAATMVFLLGL